MNNIIFENMDVHHVKVYLNERISDNFYKFFYCNYHRMEIASVIPRTRCVAKIVAKRRGLKIKDQQAQKSSIIRVRIVRGDYDAHEARASTYFRHNPDCDSPRAYSYSQTLNERGTLHSAYLHYKLVEPN